MQFEGIYTPIITPLNADESIDYDGLATVVEHLLEEGVHGIISGGTTGEYYAQSAAERIEHMRFVKERVAGRAAVLGGVGALRTAEAVAFAEQARAIGVDALLINAPAYCLPDPQELASHALAIDRAADLPIMLYNYPGRTGTLMSAPFLDLVGDNPNFTAIKESSGDINQLHMLACDYPHIQLSCGMDDQALEFFAWGATSWVCAGSNCLAREHLALYRACVERNDLRQGRAIMRAMMPFMTVLEQGGKFIQSVKFGCEVFGLPAGPSRKPLLPLGEDDRRAVADVVKQLRAAVAAIENGTDAASGAIAASA